jgi:hypothetical protein
VDALSGNAVEQVTIFPSERLMLSRQCTWYLQRMQVWLSATGTAKRELWMRAVRAMRAVIVLYREISMRKRCHVSSSEVKSLQMRIGCKHDSNFSSCHPVPYPILDDYEGCSRNNWCRDTGKTSCVHGHLTTLPISVIYNG